MDIHYQKAEEAVQLIKSGDRVFIHGGAATPKVLLNKLLDRAGEISDVELVCISTHGAIRWNSPEVLSSFRLNSLFVSANQREWANSSHGNYTPVFLSEIPGLFEQKILPLDVAIVHVSPPDQHGYCTLGTSVDVAISAVKNAPVVIAQVNRNMPRVLGDGVIHYAEFNAMVWVDSPLPEVEYGAASDTIAEQVSFRVASLIENGSTLQMGIGTIPDAVLNQLSGHKELGVHTEMFSDSLIPLVEKGVITNQHKKK